jgi:hypothetical protein
MSVTPTDEELVVALDFEGQTDFFYPVRANNATKIQVWTALKDPFKKTHFSYYSTRQSPI